jgi:DNA-binding transcriptional ArsR family regulator
MVERLSTRSADARRLNRVYGAISDPTRRAMLGILAGGEVTVGTLADRFPITFNGVSKHVKVLEQAGLVARKKIGRTHLCRLNARPLEEAERWLRQWEKFWNVRLDRLEAAIHRDKMPKKEKDNG